MSRYRSSALRVPDEAHRVATFNSDGELLDVNGASYEVPTANLSFPPPVVLTPNNSAGTATVNLSTANYASGTRVYIEPTASAGTHNVTITADGSFVDNEGAAVQQCVLNASGAFAICDIIGGVTVLAAYKGADLTT
jgi:hypothetical protein